MSGKNRMRIMASANEYYSRFMADYRQSGHLQYYKFWVITFRTGFCCELFLCVLLHFSSFFR